MTAVGGHFLSVFAVFLGKLRYLGEFLQNIVVAVAGVGHKTVGAVLHALFRPLEVAAAVAAQRVEGTVAEQAVEILGVSRFMTGEELTGGVLGERVGTLAGRLIEYVCHTLLLRRHLPLGEIRVDIDLKEPAIYTHDDYE